MPDARRFTRVDDDLIVAQSRGLFSIGELMRLLHASRDTVMRRADELGVELHININRRPTLWKTRQTWDQIANAGQLLDDSRNPVHIGTEDKLLNALNDNHGDRRYEELDLKLKPKGTT